MTQPLPLTGVRVIELGQNASAPFAGTILADLGARVVKVEPPGGDEARRWGPPFVDGVAGIYVALNRNKETIEVDLRNTEARDRLRELIPATADICLQNLRPGRADELGLGAEELRGRNPRLIYCTIGAFGNRGPLADRPAFDALAQAMCGLMSVTGQSDGPALRTGTSLCDLGAGMWAALGAISLLFRRQTTGVGGVVDTSLFETGLGWMGYHITNALISGAEPGRHGTGHPLVVPNASFPTADGHVLVAANNDRLFGALCAAIGEPSLRDDPRFSSNAARVANRHLLEDLLCRALAAASTAQWIARFQAANVPCAPILSVREAAAHPQTEALDIIAGDPPALRLPLSIDGERPG